MWRVEDGLTEIDAEFKFAKIQNSYVEGGGSRKLVLSSNFLKSKIPMVLRSNLLKS